MRSFVTAVTAIKHMGNVAWLQLALSDDEGDLTALFVHDEAMCPPPGTFKFSRRQVGSCSFE
jgi:hypothetical protein